MAEKVLTDDLTTFAADVDAKCTELARRLIEIGKGDLAGDILNSSKLVAWKVKHVLKRLEDPKR